MVIATGFWQQRVVCPGMDKDSANMAANVLNDIENQKPRAERLWFYLAVSDTYEMKA